jgi:hypothetical protein
MTTYYPQVRAVSRKVSSRAIYIFITFIWNFTASEKDIFPVYMKAPPFMSIVAASGTVKTRYPLEVKT